MLLQLDGQGELRGQLVRALRQAIRDGRLASGTKLPSTRQLAHDMSLSRNTVVAAYETLCALQLATSAQGSGTYVAQVKRKKRTEPQVTSVAPQSPAITIARELGLPKTCLLRRTAARRVDELRS